MHGAKTGVTSVVMMRESCEPSSLLEINLDFPEHLVSYKTVVKKHCSHGKKKIGPIYSKVRSNFLRSSEKADIPRLEVNVMYCMPL